MLDKYDEPDEVTESQLIYMHSALGKVEEARAYYAKEFSDYRRKNALYGKIAFHPRQEQRPRPG